MAFLADGWLASSRLSSCSCLILLLLECFLVPFLQLLFMCSDLRQTSCRSLFHQRIYFCGTSLMRGITTDYLIPLAVALLVQWVFLYKYIKAWTFASATISACVQSVPNASYLFLNITRVTKWSHTFGHIFEELFFWLRVFADCVQKSEAEAEG